MYKSYTRQAVSDDEYLELLGVAIYVFNSNNSFIIENILRISDNFDWYTLIDKTSGSLNANVKNTIDKIVNNDSISKLFGEVIDKRNRIIYSYPITRGGERVLCTKDKNNSQFIITKEYLRDFIKKNEKLCLFLHEYRCY